MRKLLAAAAFLLALAGAAPAQTPPPTFPANTVYGRLGTGPGPGQAIPFTTLAPILASALNLRPISVTSFSGLCSGGDDTSSFTAAIAQTAAAREALYIPGGTTCIIDGSSLASFATIIGDGPTSIIKRKASAVNAVVLAGNVNNVTIRNVAFDGNKSNNSVSAYNLFLAGNATYANQIYDITTKNAKGSSGIAFITTADAAQSPPTYTQVGNLISSDNEGGGIYADRASNFILDGFTATGDGGVSFFSSLSGAANSASNITVRNVNVDCRGISNNGISFGGLVNSSAATPSTQNVTAQNIVVANCPQYGIAFQVANGFLTGVHVSNSGTALGGAALLFTGNHMTLTDGEFDWPTGSIFVVDMGGCIDCTLSNGSIVPAPGSTNTGAGINGGGSLNTTIQGFRITDGSGSGASLMQFLPEQIQTNSANLTLIGNTLTCFSTNCAGIVVSDGFNGVTLADNVVTGTTAALSYQIDAAPVFWQGKNRGSADTTNAMFSVTSASTLVIPETVDFAFVTGTATVNKIITTRQNSLSDKVAWVTVTAAGTGCAANTTFTLSFTGGGGAGAAGQAFSNASGVLYNQTKMSNLGSGYTSVPTVALASPGTCSGVTLTAAFQPTNLVSTRMLGLTAGTGFTITNNVGGLGSILSSNLANISVTNDARAVYFTNQAGTWGQTTSCPLFSGDVATGAACATTVSAIGGKTVTLGGAFTMSGAFTFTGTLTGNTAVTFPTSGTLATTTSSIGCSQLPALTGDVTTSAGSCATTNVNLPTGVTMAGSLLATEIAAPGTPAAGKVSIWTDSTDARFHDKNPAGTIGTTVVADTGASNNFLTAISAAGVISKARPTCSNLSDAATSCATDATNASNISSGTLSTGRLTGSYTGITAVGTLTGLAVGNGSTALNITFNGSNSGTAGGVAFNIQNTSSVFLLGNKSAVLGGAYDGTPIIYGGATGTSNLEMYSNGTFALRITSTQGLQLGTSGTVATLTASEFAMAKITASGSAPGAGFGKFDVVAGTSGGTCKLIMYAGTSTTPVTVVDNVGSGC